MHFEILPEAQVENIIVNEKSIIVQTTVSLYGPFTFVQEKEDIKVVIHVDEEIKQVKVVAF